MRENLSSSDAVQLKNVASSVRSVISKLEKKSILVRIWFVVVVVVVVFIVNVLASENDVMIVLFAAN